MFTWRPTTHTTSLCVFSTAIGQSVDLLDGVVHNANWAVAHGATFTLFRGRSAGSNVHLQWEKVIAAQSMLRRAECKYIMHIDADAIVADIERAPLLLLNKLIEEAKPSAPIMFATCNSPLGRQHDCDTLCCGRARDGASCCKPPHKRPPRCAVALEDDGPGSPYPCMINSGVWFLRNTPAATDLLSAWAAKRSKNPEIFGEQASLNEIKASRPEDIEIVGAQVMNTPAAFHKRMMRRGAGNEKLGRAAYDLALRVTSGYEPTVEMDKRLNKTLYSLAAMHFHGAPLGSSKLQELLTSSVGECASDPSAFICHPFARPIEMKQALTSMVSKRSRSRLEELLHTQQLGFRSMQDVQSESLAGTCDKTWAWCRAMETASGLKRRMLNRSSGNGGKGSGKGAAFTARFAEYRGGRARKQQQQLPQPVASSSNAELVAVCLAGAFRTFLQPIVQASFVNRLHYEGYEYFISTDEYRPNNTDGSISDAIRLSPIRAWIGSGGHDEGLINGRPNTPERDLLPRGKCPRNTCNPFRFLLPFASRLQECYYAIQAEEGARSIRYSMVLRLRPDHLFLKVLPRVTLRGGWLGRQVPKGHVLLWDDQMSLSRREDMSSALLAPLHAYSACVDEKEWQAALTNSRRCMGTGCEEHNLPPNALYENGWSMDKCRETGFVPCTAMALITVFGKATSWEDLPLRAVDWSHMERQTGSLKAAVRLFSRGGDHGDFCLKRPLFTNETTNNENGANAPELGLGC